MSRVVDPSSGQLVYRIRGYVMGFTGDDRHAEHRLRRSTADRGTLSSLGAACLVTPDR